MKQYRIYVDTSVFGGCYDNEFSFESRKLFNELKEGKFTLVISTVTLRELDRAPKQVQKILSTLPPQNIETIPFSKEIIFLRDEYLNAGILKQTSKDDAEHITSATVAGVDFLVSWNFKHIVHFEKIQGYNAINLLNGYKSINIFSPKEIV